MEYQKPWREGWYIHYSMRTSVSCFGYSLKTKLEQWLVIRESLSRYAINQLKAPGSLFAGSAFEKYHGVFVK